MSHLVHHLNAAPANRDRHVVVSNAAQRIVPQNLPAFRIEAKQMPIATGINLSVVIEHCHILVVRRG